MRTRYGALIAHLPKMSSVCPTSRVALLVMIYAAWVAIRSMSGKAGLPRAISRPGWVCMLASI